MAIDIRGIPIGGALRAHVLDRVTDALARIPAKPVSALVTFFDENGPKGGRAMRCALTVRRPYRPNLRAEDLAETPRLAFDGGLAKLERELARARERDLESKRHPKKQYVARQLLEHGEAGPGAARKRKRKAPGTAAPASRTRRRA
jgi:ribosome-associated translation inhibitor RaiA